MKLCSSCGVSNDDDAAFCVACDAFLEWAADPGPASPIPPQSPGPRHDAPAQQPSPGSPAAPDESDLTVEPDLSLASDQPLESEHPVEAFAPDAGQQPAAVDLIQLPIRQQPTPRQTTARQPTARPAAQPAVPPPDADEFGREQQLVRQAMAGLNRGRELAVAKDRADLAVTLDSARARLDQRSITVAVVGEFKRGKSTLVNALLQTAVCPVDADEVTVVPTIVRYGETPSATAYLEAAGARRRATDRRRCRSTRSPNGSPRPGIRATAGACDRSRSGSPAGFLRAGLCLIDTPGVGGLDSAHGIITLGALDQADGIAVRHRRLPGAHRTRARLLCSRPCSAARVRPACVTKTDLYPEWRRIVEIDEGHLRAAGTRPAGDPGVVVPAARRPSRSLTVRRSPATPSWSISSVAG